MTTLNQKNLAYLPAAVAIPRYDRSKLKRAIVHLGVGGFHRSHQAVYTDEAIAAGDAEWGLVGAGILKRDKKMEEALLPQDFLYTVVSKGREATEVRVVGSVADYVYGGDGDRERVLAALSAGSTRIISLTVTEEGYCAVPETGELDWNHPGVIHDLAQPEEPETAVGFITEALERVRKTGLPPPTVMSCDNIPHNGKVLRRLVLSLAGSRRSDLARFIEDKVSFPNTMVDRITPITKDEHRRELAELYGVVDRWPVFCEDFRQWIVEDSFTRGRPDWAVGGARFAADVVPYERMKLRLLNGAHMALSHLSYLLGFRDVDKALGDPQVLAFVEGFIDETIPTVGPVPGMNLEDYKRSLISRFGNPAIRDQVFRLTMDSSRKIPNMMMPALSDLIAAGASARHFAFANAAWIRFSRGIDENGEVIEIDDKRKALLRDAALGCGADARPFLSIEGIFPRSVAENKNYVDLVGTYLREITNAGIRQALTRFLMK